MHAGVARTDLSRVLSSIARIVETRSTIPILSHVVLTAAEDGTLAARGTDLDVEIVASIAADVSAPGTACVPARNLADIVKRMVGDTVTLEFSAGAVANIGTLHVRSGRSHFRLPSIPHASMPTLDGADMPHSFTVDLSALCAPVAFAASNNDPQRPALEGVHLVPHDGKLRAVAADGARMAIHDADLPAGADDMPPIVLPRRMVDLAGKGEVTVSIGKTMTEFILGDTVIRGKLIEQPYVPYERGIPQGCDQVVHVNKSTFADAVARVSIVAAETSGKPVRLAIGGGVVQLKAADKDGRDAEDEVPCSYDGPAINVAFQSGLLTDTLGAAPGDEIYLWFGNERGFTKVTAVGNDNWLGALGTYRV